jgi:glycerol-3-phosphate cytidylyltransferase
MKIKTIYTAGTFDLMHFGHLNILIQAKKLGSKLVVGVSSDKLIKSYKGLKPIISYRDRVSIIKELKCVSKVIKQDKFFDIEQLRKYKIHIVEIFCLC